MLVPKPDGRISSDIGKIDLGKRFVHWKTQFLVSTFNVRTLAHPAKKQELCDQANHFTHRISHCESLLQEKISNYTFVIASAEKNSINATIGGVGLLLSIRALRACRGIVKHSELIVTMTLIGNPETTISSCYRPTNILGNEEEVIQFYKELSVVIFTIPADNLFLVCGDFNAKLGPEKFTLTYLPDTNRNGKHLLDFMEQFNLFATNTKFQNQLSRLWTHRYPQGHVVQLDYILAKRKWQNSIKNCRAYNSFQSVGSDHKIVSCRCQISYRQSKAPVKDPVKMVDWKRVTADPKLCEDYSIAL